MKNLIFAKMQKLNAMTKRIIVNALIVVLMMGSAVEMNAQGVSRELHDYVLPPKDHQAFFEPLGYPAQEGKQEWVCPAPPSPEKDWGPWAEGLKPVQELTTESLVREMALLEPRLHRSINVINAIIARYDAAYNEFWGRVNAVNNMVERLDYVNDPTKNEAQKKASVPYFTAALSAPEYARALNSPMTPIEPHLNRRAKEYYDSYGGLENARKAKRTKWDPNGNVAEETSVGGAAVGKLLADGKTYDVDGMKFLLYLKTAKGDFFRLTEVNKQALEGKDVVIPGHIMHKGKAYPVTEIGSSALAGAGVKTVSIPNTVTTIERSAFTAMPYLKTIEIPSSVKEIKHFAFSGCKELTELRIPDSVTKLGGQIFENCPKLANVVMPKNLKTLDMNMFKDCQALKTVTLPENLVSIPQRCFYNCRSLTGINIPETVKSIGSEAFYNCSSLGSLELPHALETIGWAAFKNCSKISSLYIPSSVTDIDTETTAGCKSLKSITMSSVYNNYYVLVGIFGGSEIFPMSYVNAAKIPPAFKFEDNE